MQTNYKSKYKTTVKASIEKVWDALTNPEKVKMYFFNSNLITSWKEGSGIYFKGENLGKLYLDKGMVIEYRHMEKLVYSFFSKWSGKDDIPENYLIVTYEVKAIKDETELSISQTNYDDGYAKHSLAIWDVIVAGLKEIVE